MARAVWIGMAALLLGSPTRAADADDAAAKWVESIGGKVVRDAKQSGNPVVDIDLAVNRKVTNDGLKALADLKSIKRLGLFANEQITDVGMAHLKGSTSLEHLVLTNSGVSDAGLAELKSLKNLRVLGLTGADRLTDAAADTINGFTALEELALPSTITGKGIAKLTGLKKMRNFYLNWGSPGDEGVKAIAANMPELETIGVTNFEPGGNGITDASVPHLAKLKKLKTASLVGSKFTDTGVKELRLSLPECIIKVR